MNVLVTGGAGFIGGTLVRRLLGRGCRVVNVDALTYAAAPEALAACGEAGGYGFVRADIADADAMAGIFARHRPDAVVHLAAESHVDRSIAGPAACIRTNVTGTSVLLDPDGAGGWTPVAHWDWADSR